MEKNVFSFGKAIIHKFGNVLPFQSKTINQALLGKKQIWRTRNCKKLCGLCFRALKFTYPLIRILKKFCSAWSHAGSQISLILLGSGSNKENEWKNFEKNS
jgi:hypothetical protein